MQTYMLLLHQNLDRPRPSSPDEIMAVTKEYMAWADRMRADGRYKGGHKLTEDAGKIIRPNGGRHTTTDGPYAESKEVVGGFFLIDANDYEEASGLAETCPHLKFGGRVEIRRVDH